jgi:hypothetical protein
VAPLLLSVLLLLACWQQVCPAMDAAPAATTLTSLALRWRAALLHDANTTSVKLSSTAACNPVKSSNYEQ